MIVHSVGVGWIWAGDVFAYLSWPVDNPRAIAKINQVTTIREDFFLH